MFHNRTLNNRINRIHERALKIVNRDRTSKLLQKGNAVTVHQKNIEVLATEVYKGKTGPAQQLVTTISPLRTQACNLRYFYEFKFENIKTVHCGTESLSFLGPKI